MSNIQEKLSDLFDSFYNDVCELAYQAGQDDTSFNDEGILEGYARQAEELFKSEQQAPLDRVYDKRYIMIIKPGVSRFVVTANDIKQVRSEL